MLSHPELLQLKRWNTSAIYNGWEQITPLYPAADGFNREEWTAALGTEGLSVPVGEERGLDRRVARAWVTADKGTLLTAATTDSLKAVFNDSLIGYAHPRLDAADSVASVRYHCLTHRCGIPLLRESLYDYR